MITKYSALPFTKKFQLKQASPRPPGHFQICFAYESLPNLNIKHHLVFGNEKKNCKTFNFFLNVIYFDAFSVIHVLHVIFYLFFFSFFFLCSWCWNVVRWEGWERQKHTTEQADVSLHYCIQEWQWGLGVGGGLEVGGPNQKPKKICTTTSVDRKQSGSHLMACDASQCHIL